LFLKTLVSEMVHSSVGREFHDAGPQKEKARSPNLVSSRGVVYRERKLWCSAVTYLQF